MQAINIVVNLK